MEKINGVIMDGHTVVDIDRNADEVVIPEYAKDTTYQLPLYGIKSMEVSDLMLLAQFAGLPKRLVLNDKGNLASYSLSYWSGVNAIDSVLGRAGLEWLELTDDNPYFKTVDGILYSKDGYKLVKCPVERNGSVKIADGTVSVEPRAFENSEISAVEFPDSLQDVRNKAFSNCKNLEHVNFGHGIQRIGSSSRCFQSCHKLKRIEFPEQVRNIGEKSFMNCGLEEVIFHEGLKSISSSAFAYCDELKKIFLPDSLQYIGRFNFAEVEDIYLNHSVPVGLLSIISSNFSATYTPMYSQRLDVLSIHIDNDIIYVPKSLNLSGQTEILTILEERDKKRYGDTFKLSYLEQAKQDTAFFTYAYGTPNKNTKEYLKEQADEIAKRYLKAGHTELLVKLLQAGFVSRNGLNVMLEMLKEDSKMNLETQMLAPPVAAKIDRQEPVVMAYIMQALEECRRKNGRVNAENLRLD